MGDKNQPLAVELHGETLSITIGTAALSEEVLARQVDDGIYEVEDEYSLACQLVTRLREKFDTSNGRKSRMLLVLVSDARCCPALVFHKNPEPSEQD